MQSFAYEEAYKETDRQTYQSMEGFIHNLNTMHSRAATRYAAITTRQSLTGKNQLRYPSAGRSSNESKNFKKGLTGRTLRSLSQN